LNFRRKSTTGWNICNVLLDISGGVLSIAQLLLDGATLGWAGVIGEHIRACKRLCFPEAMPLQSI
jgi:cystinosin